MKSFIITFSLIFIINTTYAQHVRFNPIPNQFPTGSQLDFVDIGDINGDGLNDIAGATTYNFHTSNSINNYSIVVWLQGTNGQMQQPLFFKHPYPGTVNCFAVKDLGKSSSKSGIGNAEIVLGLIHSNYQDVYIYSWDGNTLIATDSFETSNKDAPDAVTTGDFDNDGLTDIAVSHARDSLTVIFQNSNNPVWDVKKYPLFSNGTGHAISGHIGGIPKTALVILEITPISVLYFDSNRSLLNTHSLILPADQNGYVPSSIFGGAIVNKGGNNNNELWITYSSSNPLYQLAIWRNLQQLPDSIFRIFGSPEGIASSNLDCDDGDEPVILEITTQQLSVFTDSIFHYKTRVNFVSTHDQEAIGLGDINNDGFADMCHVRESKSGDLQVFYNITPPCKWPANISETKVVVGKIDIYPNPASAETTIAYNGTGELRVYNIQGSIVTKSQFDKRSVLNTSGWPAGLYIITLHTGSSIISEKLVIH